MGCDLPLIFANVARIKCSNASAAGNRSTPGFELSLCGPRSVADAKRFVRLLLGASLAAGAPPALAQAPAPAGDETKAAQAPAPAPNADPGRASENAVRRAGDAFGTSIGRETIGLYSAGSVRGFSANAAGNARINGLYYDPVWTPPPRIRSSTDIRVGLSAQGFAFPAPTGVVDYALRTPGREPVLTGFTSLDTYGSAALEADAVLPLGPTLSVGGGVGLYRNAFYNGTAGKQHVEGVTARWEPAPGIRLLPFWSQSHVYDDEFGPIYVPAGAYLPPSPPRRRFFGPQRPHYRSNAMIEGVVGDMAVASDWRLQVGLFRSRIDDLSTLTNLFTDLTPQGTGRQILLVDPPNRLASTSGEARLSRSFAEGPRQHTFHANVRGRIRQDEYGGFAPVDLGPSFIGRPIAPIDGPFAFSPQTHDRIRQWVAGLAYEGRWNGVGTLNLGLQKTDYEKRIRQPGLPAAFNRERPWLYNAGAAVPLGKRLIAYAGYSRGLEESGVAPDNAVNRNAAVPAIRTSQRDAGLHWSLAPSLKLILGVFDVRKPYFDLDEHDLYRLLGNVRHQGIETSITGAITPRLDIVAGGVFLRARVTGESVSLGRVGSHPLGQPARNLQLNLDWRPPWLAGLSLETGVQHLSRRPARSDNSLYLPARTLADIGARYRFRLGGADMTARVRVSNVFNVYGFDLRGSGAFDLIPGRVGYASLAVDFK